MYVIKNILKEFKEYYTSIEKLLNEACVKANSECNADVLQAIGELHKIAKFIEVDCETFNDILTDIDKYVADDKEEDEELN